MQFDESSERAYRRRRMITLLVVLGLFVFILVMFIVSAVNAHVEEYEICPSKIAFIKTIKTYYVFDKGKKTNTSFVDVTYGIGRIAYENFTSTELAEQYKLQAIYNENGAIKVYKDCNINEPDYFLGPMLQYKTNRWMTSAILFGHALCIFTVILIAYCCTVCFSDSVCMNRLFSL